MKTINTIFLLVLISTGMFAQNNNFSIKNNTELIYSKTLEKDLAISELLSELSYTSGVTNIQQLSNNIVRAEISDYVLPNVYFGLTDVYPFATYFVYAKVVIEKLEVGYKISVFDIYTSPSNTNQIYYMEGALAEYNKATNKLEFKTKSKVIRSRELFDKSFSKLFSY